MIESAVISDHDITRKSHKFYFFLHYICIKINYFLKNKFSRV